MRAMRFTLAALLLAATAAQSQAATILYDNGAINGTVDAWSIGISGSGQVSNSFSLSGPSTLSSVELGVWVNQGATPVQLSWAIGTTAFGSEKGSGSSPLNSTLNNSGVFGLYDVFKSTFAINGTLAAGSYWLTLSNATATNQGPVYWDQNSGMSQAFRLNTGSPIRSESFKILGDPVRNPPTRGPVVPEPTSLALAGFAGIGMAVRALRRRRQQDQPTA